jgi:hypothetical protein
MKVNRNADGRALSYISDEQDKCSGWLPAMVVQRSMWAEWVALGEGVEAEGDTPAEAAVCFAEELEARACELIRRAAIARKLAAELEGVDE